MPGPDALQPPERIRRPLTNGEKLLAGIFGIDDPIPVPGEVLSFLLVDLENRFGELTAVQQGYISERYGAFHESGTLTEFAEIGRKLGVSGEAVRGGILGAFGQIHKHPGTRKSELVGPVDLGQEAFLALPQSPQQFSGFHYRHIFGPNLHELAAIFARGTRLKTIGLVVGEYRTYLLQHPDGTMQKDDDPIRFSTKQIAELKPIIRFDLLVRKSRQ